jgi:DNA (cytosine-5)-methyltransferase 1
MKYISLFSGAMGLDLGFEDAGFSPAIFVENDPAAVATIRANRPKLPVIDRSIADVTGSELRRMGKLGKRVPLIIGGPPCQAFSVFGNRKGLEDTRGQLVFEFVRVVKELKPDAFVMENVRGLLSMPYVSKRSDTARKKPELAEPGSLLRRIFEAFNESGYRVDCYVVNVVNYGAPQLRERLILIGNRHGLRANFLPPQFSNRPNDRLPPFRTLADAIGGNFKDPYPEVMNFSKRKLDYLAQIPPGGNWRSLPIEGQKESMGKSWYLKGGRSAYWRKLSYAFPSPTVVTMPNHAGTSMCHPSELRAISVGEAAAIQEFPREWIFCGTTTEKMRQIGNAVPVRLGRVAAIEVRKLFERISKRDRESVKLPAYQVVHVRPHVRTRTYWRDGLAFAGDHSYYDGDQEMRTRQLQLPIA